MCTPAYLSYSWLQRPSGLTEIEIAGAKVTVVKQYLQMNSIVSGTGFNMAKYIALDLSASTPKRHLLNLLAI